MCVSYPETVKRPQPVGRSTNRYRNTKIINSRFRSIPFPFINSRSILSWKAGSQEIRSHLIPHRNFQTNILNLNILEWSNRIYIIHPSVRFHNSFTGNSQIIIFYRPFASNRRMFLISYCWLCIKLLYSSFSFYYKVY